MITNTLPLTDLYHHLDGNIRRESILELGQKFSLPLPIYDLEGLAPICKQLKLKPI